MRLRRSPRCFPTFTSARRMTSGEAVFGAAAALASPPPGSLPAVPARASEAGAGGGGGAGGAAAPGAGSAAAGAGARSGAGRRGRCGTGRGARRNRAPRERGRGGAEGRGRLAAGREAPRRRLAVGRAEARSNPLDRVHQIRRPGSMAMTGSSPRRLLRCITARRGRPRLLVVGHHGVGADRTADASLAEPSTCGTGGTPRLRPY